MSIKDNIHYKEIYHDYDIFKDCFGDSKIMPTDIDGIVERNGNFLVMEFKPEGKEISSGQHTTLYKLSKLPKFTVIILYHKELKNFHDPKEIVSMEIYPIRRYKYIHGCKFYNFDEIKKSNNIDAQTFVRNWHIMANKETI